MRREDYEKLSPEEQAVEDRHRKTTYRATIQAVLASVPIIGAIISGMFWLATPRVVGLLAAASSPAVEAQIQQRITPLNEGFKVILQQQIEDLQRDINRLEFEQSQDGANWTLDKVNELQAKRDRLQATRMALQAILSAERYNRF